METQTCTKCRDPKSVDEFAFKSKAAGKRNSWCKSCQKPYKDQHYQNHKQVYIKKAHEYRADYKARIYALLAEYYKQHPCVDCGADDFIVCQSDHVRGKKFEGISRLIQQDASWERILEELKKCETRCANCHMRKTAKQFGWYKDLVAYRGIEPLIIRLKGEGPNR